MEGRDTGLSDKIESLFPKRLVRSDQGDVPYGWKVKPLGQLIELAYGKALRAKDRKNGTIPVFGSNGQVGWHDRSLVEGPGIVVGRKGNPGVVKWVHTDFFPIDTTFYVRPKEEGLKLPFIFHALKGQNLGSLGADSAVPGLNRNLAYLSGQIVPSNPVLEVFGEYMVDLFGRIHCLTEESQTIANIRDTLLPRLVSGKIRLSS